MLIDCWLYIQQTSYTTANMLLQVFFVKHTPTTEIYTLPLHDALPISGSRRPRPSPGRPRRTRPSPSRAWARSEEHTSELQSRVDLVCRLLLEKKKKNNSLTPQNVLRLASVSKQGDYGSPSMELGAACV